MNFFLGYDEIIRTAFKYRVTLKFNQTKFFVNLTKCWGEQFLAALVLANHVIAATVLLDGCPALGALLRVGRDPVGRLAVVITLLGPLPDQRAPHGVVPVF